MYWNHFGLSAEPFSLTPDPAFLYLSEGHSEALAALKLGLLERRGLVALIGEVGTGKTTLLYSLLAGLDAEIRTAYVSNTRLNFDGILRGALRDFGVKRAGADRLEMLEALNEFLLECAENDTTAALIIDEAQNLSHDAFEEIRLLSNFETYTTKLLQIVLVGQPELATKLAERNLRQINERIAVRAYLNPLEDEEARHYIQHRLEAAGATREVFEHRALRRIVNYSRGVPRRINILCHNSLLHAYGRESATVTREIVEEVIRDQTGGGLKRLDTSSAAAPEPEPSEPPAPEHAFVWRSVTRWAAAGIAVGSLATWLVMPSFLDLTRRAPIGTVEAVASALRGSMESASRPATEDASRSNDWEGSHGRARHRREVSALSPRAKERLARMIAALEAADAAVPASDLAPIAAAIAADAPAAASPISRAALEPTASTSAPAPAAVPIALAPTASASVPTPIPAPIAGEIEEMPTVVASAIPPSQSSASVPAPTATGEIPFAAAPAKTPLAPRTAARTVSVPRGSSLSLLMLNIYGEYNGELLHTVRKANPEIIDPDFILAGQEIRFPKPQTTAAPPADRSQDHE